MSNIQYGLTIVGVIIALSVIVVGLDSCDSRQQAFKLACVNNSGSVVSTGGGVQCISRGNIITKE